LDQQYATVSTQHTVSTQQSQQQQLQLQLQIKRLVDEPGKLSYKLLPCNRRFRVLAQKITIASKLKSNKNSQKLECGPMTNVMAALPNIGGALCSTPQSLADTHY